MKGYNEGSLNVVTILSIGEPRQYLVLAIGTTHVSRYTTLGVLFLVKTNQSWYQRG